MKKLLITGALVIFILLCTAFLFTACASSAGATSGETFTINIDKTSPLFQSNFIYGLTHTHYWWHVENPIAVQRAKGLVKDISTVHNVHIMGWGSGNPWPSKTANFNFRDIKERVDLAIELGGEPWITFCTAPGWMKGTHDWAMEEAPLPEFEDDFAHLCAEVAKAFPEVKVFQVWNEFKGMWADGGQVDYVRYTRLYNKVYTAVKAVRPDAELGGFYAVLEGDGTFKTFGGNFEDNRHTSEPLNNLSRDAIAYFLANAIDMDYFLVDRANVDYHNDGYWSWQTRLYRATRDQAMRLTKYFQKATKEVAELTTLPIVWSEYYGTYGDGKGEFRRNNQPYIGAHYASIAYNMIMGAGGRDLYALLWIEWEHTVRHALFTDPLSPAGGRPTPHYFAMKKLIDNFPKGTMLYTANISSPDLKNRDLENRDLEQDVISDLIEVLASEKIAYVINKTNTVLTIILNGVTHELRPYAVEVFNYN